MTTVWVTIAVLALGTLAIKSSGPLTLRGRRPGGRALAVITLIAPSVLAALVVYETLVGHPSGIVVDARVVGLGAAVLALWARLPMTLVMVAAAVATALTRLVT
jgi:hypothetical protein